MADIFPTRAEMCHKNSRTSPAAQTKKYYGSRMCHECVTNVSRMCHKKVEPKSTFWEVTSLHLEPADLVNKHVLPKVKEAASQSFLMRKLPKGSASMTRLFSYRRRSRKRAHQVFPGFQSGKGSWECRRRSTALQGRLMEVLAGVGPCTVHCHCVCKTIVG